MYLFNQHINGRIFTLVVVESALLFFGVIFAAWVRFSFVWERTLSYGVLPKAAFITVVCQMVLYYSDLYALKGRRNLRETFLSFLQAMGLSYIILSLSYYLIPELIIGRGIGVLSFIGLLLLLTTWRSLFDRFLTASQMMERVLIIGTGEMSRRLAREILDDPSCGLLVTGFISSDPSDIGRSIVNPVVLGTIDQLDEVVREHRIARIVVALDERRGTFPVREILNCKLQGIKVQESTALLEQISGRISVEDLRPSWIIFSEGFQKTHLTKQLKRLIDLSISSILILIVWPVLLVIAAAIRIDSRGPVLYRQKRVGEWGREFTLYKFRSMAENAESNGPQWATRNDSRVTRVGKVIRKLRLDELPQLYNVFKGQMSLVGPRPERPEFVRQLRDKIPYYDERHSVKPGVTGWAQVKFTYGNTIQDSLEKLEYDLYYVKHISPIFDFLIIFLTVKVVLLGRGAL